MRDTKIPALLVCLRCGYEWRPDLAHPKVCPRCKSHKWNEARVKA